MKDIYKKENLEVLVKESKFLSEVIRKLGLRDAGGNFRTLQKYLKLHGIDYSHFAEEHKKQIADIGRKALIPLELVLVENSTYTRTTLKERLYKLGIKQRVCELCGQGEIWNGRKMSLIIDHINGVYNDNRLENLQIVCPNCNATLDTFCGKNVKKKDKKPSQLDPNWRKVPKLSIRKVKRPSLEQLLQDVKETNFLQTGKKYGVSDNSIRKWIKAYEFQESIKQGGLI